MNKGKILVSIILFVIIITCFIIDFKLQFFCAVLSASIIFLIFSIVTQKSFIQYLCIIIFSIGVVLSALELYYAAPYFPKPPESRLLHGGYYTEAGNFFNDHERLGYASHPNSYFLSMKRKFFLDNSTPEVIYDRVYTIDERGHRITPHHPDAKVAVLIFGGSYAFGEGLADEESLCYRIGEILGQNYQVFNFGFPGYGTHHMLAIIEGDLSYLDKYEYIYAFYIGITDHINRYTGFGAWDTGGPRYMMEGDKAVRRGSFKQYFPQNIADTLLGKILNKSHTYKANIHNLKKIFLPYSDFLKQMQLFRAIIDTSVNKLTNIYPHNKFSIVAWDSYSEHIIQYAPGHLARYDANKWLPNYDDDKTFYEIPDDGHPNALANEIVGEKIAKLVQEHESER